MGEVPTASGLGYIHFALHRSSAPAARALAGRRRASLLYSSSTRGAYCTVDGLLSVLTDNELRRHYWKSHWASAFPCASAVGAQEPDSLEQVPPWSSGDYVLVRLAVDEVVLRLFKRAPRRGSTGVSAGKGAPAGVLGRVINH